MENLLFQFFIYSKQITGLSTDGRVVESVDSTGKTIAALRDCYLTSQSFNFAEGGIAGFNVSGNYLTSSSIKSVIKIKPKMNETLNFKVSGNTYVIKFPTVGDYYAIEASKQSLSVGYYNKLNSGDNQISQQCC